jgi:hypothetical protein
MLVECELKSLKQTAKIGALVTKQGEFHDALEKNIEDLEAQLKE